MSALPRTTLLSFALALASVAQHCTASADTAPELHRLHIRTYARAYQAVSRRTTGSDARTTSVRPASNSFAIVTGDYALSDKLSVSASYQYTTANPFSQQPALNNLLQLFASYATTSTTLRVGDEMFNSPWAYSHLTLGMAPSAYQGIFASHKAGRLQTDFAAVDRFNAPGGTAFMRSTLLTNLSPGASASGFIYAHAGYSTRDGSTVADAHAYRLGGLGSLLWLTATHALGKGRWAPTIDAQFGLQNAPSDAYTGRISSAVQGYQFSITPVSNLRTYAGIDALPWHSATLVLPPQASCDSNSPHPTYALNTPGARGYFFVPTGAAQCRTRGSATTVYYGGFAAPYSDGYAWDPLFTTGAAEGQADRHNPGTSSIVGITYFNRSGHTRLDSNFDSFNYSNPLAAQKTTEFDTIARMYSGNGHLTPYHGFLVTIFYVDLRKSNTMYPNGDPFLGGTARTRYTRFQLEYFQ